MTDHEYGTVDYYSEQFSDFLADAATGDREEDEKTVANIMAGFEQAIISMMKYHEDAIATYRDIHSRFLVGELSYKDDWS